jgi:3-hydroxybutyryl-CoA dehydrogenase
MALTFNAISVFGAGTMGSGIAQVCAQAGAQVALCDPSPDALKRAQKLIEADWKKAVELKKLSAAEEQAAKSCLRYVGGLADAKGADLVIEAIFEKLEAKHELFTRIEAQVSQNAVLATNTSSLSVTAIAAKTRFPERICGLHFFNPPARMKLVEVIAAQQSSEDTVNRALAFVRDIDREPVLAKDTPGFIVNRCARPFYGEALRCLGEQIADVETIDRILKIGGGFKMGPFALMDLIGIDINYAATRSIWEGYAHEPRYKPHLLQRKMVEAGLLGRKSGRGFYEYPDVE